MGLTYQELLLAEVVRIELTHKGVKVPCLTSWLYLNIKDSR